MARSLLLQHPPSPLSRSVRRSAAVSQAAPDADRLKLNKLHRTSTLEDTPVRGMIEKVKHLVRVVDGQ